MSNSTELYNAAEKLKDAGQTEDAIAKLEELVAAEDSHVLSHLALGKLYTQLGKHEEAIAHSKKACELEPDEWFNFTAMSMTYQKAWAGTQNQAYITAAEDAMARSRELEQR